MAQIFSNYAISQTTAAINASATSISVTPLDGGKFRAPTVGEFELLTLTDGVNWEIVKLTGRTNDTLTIVRAHEGAAQSWTSGTIVKSTITRDTMERVMQTEVYGASIALFNYMNFR